MNKNTDYDLPEPTYAILPTFHFRQDKQKTKITTKKHKKYINEWYHEEFLSKYFDTKK